MSLPQKVLLQWVLVENFAEEILHALLPEKWWPQFSEGLHCNKSYECDRGCPRDMVYIDMELTSYPEAFESISTEAHSLLLAFCETLPLRHFFLPSIQIAKEVFLQPLKIRRYYFSKCVHLHTYRDIHSLVTNWKCAKAMN